MLLLLLLLLLLPLLPLLLLLLLLVITVFVAAIVVSISISLSTFNYVVTCVGLRKHRARGRICSDPNATNGRIGRLHLAFKTKAITLRLLVAHILAM